MNTFAQIAGVPPDEHLPLIRELLSYDVRCETCCTFKRDNGTFLLERTPSPLYWSRQAEWPWAITEAKLEPHHEVLDVGSGWSVLKYALAARCQSVKCIDNDADSIAKSNKTTQILGIRNVTHRQADARAIPYPDARFDRVFCISVLEHVPPPHEPVLDELLRVLRPGGRLLLSMDVSETKSTEDDNFYLSNDTLHPVLARLGTNRVMVPPVYHVGCNAGHGHTFHVLLVRCDKPL